ncbi:MAG: hypothetical protein M0R75_03215 [Dehalococcoidia bacterium]|nr:hypothetical protein [Dehalococcoidia bacterium]
MHLVMLSDDDVQARVLTAAARRRGFTTSVRGSGANSISATAEVDEESPTVVIVDVERLDRWSTAVVNRCLKTWPEAHVFVLAEHLASKGVSLPAAVHYVQMKPFHIPAFLDLVEGALMADHLSTRLVGMHGAPIMGGGPDRLVVLGRESGQYYDDSSRTSTAASGLGRWRNPRAISAFG